MRWVDAVVGQDAGGSYYFHLSYQAVDSGGGSGSGVGNYRSPTVEDAPDEDAEHPSQDSFEQDNDGDHEDKGEGRADSGFGDDPDPGDDPDSSDNDPDSNDDSDPGDDPGSSDDDPDSSDDEYHTDDSEPALPPLPNRWTRYTYKGYEAIIEPHIGLPTLFKSSTYERCVPITFNPGTKNAPVQPRSQSQSDRDRLVDVGWEYIADVLEAEEEAEREAPKGDAEHPLPATPDTTPSPGTTSETQTEPRPQATPLLKRWTTLSRFGHTLFDAIVIMHQNQQPPTQPPGYPGENSPPNSEIQLRYLYRKLHESTQQILYGIFINNPCFQNNPFLYPKYAHLFTELAYQDTEYEHFLAKYTGEKLHSATQSAAVLWNMVIVGLCEVLELGRESMYLVKVEELLLELGALMGQHTVEKWEVCGSKEVEAEVMKIIGNFFVQLAAVMVVLYVEYTAVRG
jgi:hypothetical protein